ncbi:uncharacterized protein [Tenebrio molitor]
MLFHIALVIAVVCSSQGLPRPESPQAPSRTVEPKQVLYVPERQQYPQHQYPQQQYPSELQYDLSLLDPQFQIPSYNFIGDKQHFPRVQPQIVLYHGGAAPGQSFLLQPGSPPGNFLVPQPGPNVILRDAPAPPRPLFVAGYPKPAHIPPIEKDAEEVPTNPSKIPPFTPKGESKPEKLETFNEDDNSKKQGTEADVLAAADRNPAFNPKTNLRPGQRFFILNGQPLFSNFPYNNQLYPGVHPSVNLKYAQIAPSFISQPAAKNVSPFQNVLFRNSQIDDVSATHRLAGSDLQQAYPENLVLLNQPPFQDDSLFRNPLPAFQQTKELKPQLREEIKQQNDFGIFQLKENSDQDNDAVIIEAREQDEGSNAPDTEAEVVSAADKPSEPTISQAQPGAIALAGPGGVAAAAPRGTAFVGKEGVAISSPQATAVAGPTRDEIQQKNKKQNKRRQ